MSTSATAYPISPVTDADNTLLRRILYALANGGSAGMAPQEPSNTLLRQILYQVQVNGAGGGTGGPGTLAGLVYDPIAGRNRTLTAPNGVLEVGD
jgi:hypothetical protein